MFRFGSKTSNSFFLFRFVEEQSGELRSAETKRREETKSKVCLCHAAEGDSIFRSSDDSPKFFFSNLEVGLTFELRLDVQLHKIKIHLVCRKKLLLADIESIRNDPSFERRGRQEDGRGYDRARISGLPIFCSPHPPTLGPTVPSVITPSLPLS